ncbi:unnamed protein product, partial [Trichobilharzia regenti]
FSFGLCNDPVLTETTGLNSNNNDNNNHGSSDHNLYGKKMLANNAFLDDDDDAVKNNWSCLRQDESVDQYSDKISPNYDKMMFTSSSSSSSLTKINLNTENNRTPFSDITNYLLYDSRTRTDTTTNNNSNVLTTTSSCGSSSIVSTQSSCSPSFSSNRSHRKLSKPNRLHLHIVDTPYDEDVLLDNSFPNFNIQSSFKNDTIDWSKSSMEIENTYSNNNTTTNNANNNISVSTKVNKSFLTLSSSSHVEKRIIAALRDDLPRSSNSHVRYKVNLS